MPSRSACSGPRTIEAVARALDGCRRGTPIVLDPVMVSESGAELLDPAARGLVQGLLPRATVITPNLPEARALAAVAARAEERDLALEMAATPEEAVQAPGPRADVVVIPAAIVST